MIQTFIFAQTILVLTDSWIDQTFGRLGVHSSELARRTRRILGAGPARLNDGICGFTEIFSLAPSSSADLLQLDYGCIIEWQ